MLLGELMERNLANSPTLCGEPRGGMNQNNREPYGAGNGQQQKNCNSEDRENSKASVSANPSTPSSDSSLEILKWWRTEHRANLQPSPMQLCSESNMTGGYP